MPKFQAGTKVTVDVSNDGLVVKPAIGKTTTFRFPYSESALLEDITPETAHADALATATGKELDL